MQIDKKQFNLLIKEGSENNKINKVSALHENGIKYVNTGRRVSIIVLKNGIFISVMLGNKIYINVNTITNIEIERFKVYISTEEQEKPFIFISKKSNILYNELVKLTGKGQLVEENSKMSLSDLNSYYTSVSSYNKPINPKPVKKPKEVCCPKCGSTQLTAQKKGFGLLKGAAGVLTFGAYGVVTAGIGKNKIIVTCLSCGKQFKPGK